MKKNYINLVKYKFSILIDILISFLFNIIKNLLNKNISSVFILVYAPYTGKPWILNKLIKDIKFGSSSVQNYKIFYSLTALAIFRFKYGGNVFSMHQSNIQKLYLSGIPLNQISTLYTHSQTNQKGIPNINNVRKVFCMNNYEISLLNSCGVSKSKLINFPVGIHDNFIKNRNQIKNINNRDIDILFSLRYYPYSYHYKTRKRYEFIINLSNLLSEMDYKVCILGKDWGAKKDSLSKKVNIHEIPFNEYSQYYRNSKIYCNPSLCEGGPISLIEAYASGCIIYTTPVGFSFNYCLDDHLSFLMPFESKENLWKINLINTLDKIYNDIFFEEIIDKRYEKINESTFASLSKVLETNLISNK